MIRTARRVLPFAPLITAITTGNPVKGKTIADALQPVLDAYDRGDVDDEMFLELAQAALQA